MPDSSLGLHVGLSGSASAERRPTGSSDDPVTDDQMVIFIAAPGDLREEIHRLYEELQLFARRCEIPIRPMYWKYEGLDFDPGIPCQTQIPDIFGPNVKGVICLFGEQLGTAIPKEVPKPAAFTVPPGVANPWQPSELDPALIPLTGTVFEYFLARERAGRLPFDTKDFFFQPCFKGNGDQLKNRNLDPMDRGWGLHTVYNEISTARKIKELIEYEDKVIKLTHFADAFAFSGYEPVFFQDSEELASLAAGRLERCFPIEAYPKSNPFKGLDAYSINDGRRFFGREVERNKLVADLHHFDHSRSSFIVIEGPSGSGKSSLLRAGILYKVEAEFVRHRRLAVEVRPADLVQANTSLLPALLLRIASALENRPSEANASAVNLAGRLGKQKGVELSPESFVEACDELCRDGMRLCIGVDQLEELFSNTAITEAQSQLVLHGLCLLAYSGRGWVVGALNSAWAGSWNDAIARVFSSAGLSKEVRPYKIPIGTPGLAQLREIIEEPLLRYQMRLEPQLIEALLYSFENVVERPWQSSNPEPRVDAPPSALALLSVSLSNIYERWALDNRQALAATADPGTGVSSSPSGTRPLLVNRVAWYRLLKGETTKLEGVRPVARDRDSDTWRKLADEAPPELERVLSLAHYRDLANIESAVQELGERAWEAFTTRVQRRGLSDDPNTIFQRLFRRLTQVRDARVDSFPLSLRRCSSREVEEIGAQDLLAALIEHKLAGPVSVQKAADGTDTIRWYQLTHQCVITSWSRAAAWYESDKANKLLLGRLITYASAYFSAPEETRALNLGGSRQDIRDGVLLVMRWGSDAVIEGIDIKSYLADALEVFDLPRFDAATDKDIGGGNPLAFAASIGRCDLLEKYLERGCPPDYLARRGIPALSHAVSNGHLDIARRLHAAGANIDGVVGTENYRSPLGYAIWAGHDDCARWLIDAGVDVTLPDDVDWTPIDVAGWCGNMVALAMCLDRVAATGRPIVPLAHRAMRMAAANGQAEACRAIAVDHRDWLGDAPFDSTLLYDLIEQRDSSAQVFDILLQMPLSSPRREQDLHTPLTLAIEHSRFDLCVRIIERGLWVDEAGPGGQRPLHFAVATRQESLLRQLLSAGARFDKVDADGDLPCLLAIRSDWREAVALLLDNALPLNVPNRAGDLPLLTAIERDNLEAARGLIACGANPNFADRSGMLPLAFAVNTGRAQFVDLLLHADALPTAKNAAGETALHLICQKGGEHRAGFIAQSLDPASAAIVNDKGETLLHKACEAPDGELVALLVATRLRLDQSDKQRTTPFHHLIAHGDYDIVMRYFGDIAHPLAEPAGDPMLMRFALRSRPEFELLKQLIDAGYRIPHADPGDTSPDEKNFFIRVLMRDVDDRLVDYLIELLDVAEMVHAELKTAVRRNFRGPAPNERFLRKITRLADISDALDRPLADYLVPLLSADRTAMIRAMNRHDPRQPCDAETGYSPYHVAVALRSGDCIEELGARGAPIDVRDRDGWTPLMLAVSMGDIELCRLLLSLHASPDLTLPDGRNMADLARDNSDAVMFRFLTREVSYQVTRDQLPSPPSAPPM
jgi:ankyrin repeat protein